jgi:hypothetical protein
MSHSKIRKDKRCQNCGYFVAERFCSHCGQENVETRKRFHYLFVHFWADFIHYDSLFGKTILSLFVPAKLTKGYLAGKRKSQVNPVQLYIFISFLVFFVPHILPDFDTSSKKHSENNNKEQSQTEEETLEADDDIISKFGLGHINTVEELDSIQFSLPGGKKLSIIKYVALKKLLTIKQMENPKEKIAEAVIHNFPKAIFLYMPVFAFWLWLFHSKKKWLYFDHGIYTLHYFSFILLTILIHITANWLLSIFHTEVSDLITIAMFAYFIYYFFHSHRRMYLETKTVSRLICMALFFINTICMIVFFVLFILAIAWVSAESLH